MCDSHHGHHSHHGSVKNKKLLGLAFFLTIIFSVLEIVYGFISHSLALLSDGIHMTSDGLSLLLGFVAVSVGMKVASSKMNFGFKRFETIAAFINGITLLVIPLLVIIEAIRRIVHPAAVLSKEMMIVGLIGLTVNLIVAFILSRGDKDNLNVKAAFLHVLSDLFTSVSVIVSSLVIMHFGWTIIDPIVSIVTSIVIMSGGLSITKEAYHILMEGVPSPLNYEAIRKQIEDVPFVHSVKDFRIWSISGDDYHALLHIEVSGDVTMDTLHALFHEHHIHATIEIHTK